VLLQGLGDMPGGKEIKGEVRMMDNTITVAELYKLNKRGRDAADGKSNEILVGKWTPVDDLKQLKAGKALMRAYMEADMKAIGATDYYGKVGLNRDIEVDGMPILYWWALVPKDGCDMSKVYTLEQQMEDKEKEEVEPDAQARTGR
jgi:hypothetical protein